MQRHLFHCSRRAGALAAILAGAGSALWGCAQALGLSEYEAHDSSSVSPDTAGAGAAGAGAADRLGAAAAGGAGDPSGVASAQGGNRQGAPTPDAAASTPRDVGAADAGGGAPGACGALRQACCDSADAPCNSYLRCDASVNACVTCGTLERLGTLPGDAESEARAVSGDGRVVVGRASSGPFRWSRERGMQSLGTLPGGFFSASATGVSGDGAVVVGEVTDGSESVRAFRWEEATGMVELGFEPGIAPDVFAYASAAAVSRDGSTIVGEATGVVASIGQAFIWTAESTPVNLATAAGGIGGSFSGATAVSADGSVVIGWATNEEYFQRPFAWSTVTRETLRLVDFPLGSDSVPTDTDIGGDTIVGYFEIRNSLARGAFRWTRATGRSELIEPDGRALGVNASGAFVVGAGREGAMLWSTDAGSRSVAALVASPQGFQSFQEASGISDDGRVIVGWGRNDVGALEGWIATFEGCAFP